MSAKTFLLDGQPVSFVDGQTIMDAALAAGVYIPHLCHLPGYRPQGSCKLCTVDIGGRRGAACTNAAVENVDVKCETQELNADRRSLLQMLFVEGNHFCPSCEKSGNCALQAVAYRVGMRDPHFPHFYPAHDMDASHPEVLLDRNRCILCELCVRASRDVDGKNVFAISGRGMRARLIVNASSGRLADTPLAAGDRAMTVCPTGALLTKRQGFSVPIGRRTYDLKPIGTTAPARETQHG
ncbi:MAG: NADP oxidoreductase [Betaproteobacteria bacterium RIFCSPLOWO2_02_FULL_62_17]|nr:MAG: NADP oxidoreductase [Betaproteobacteria bacterium RIFCSPLOWO2_02_FULL_62_17]